MVAKPDLFFFYTVFNLPEHLLVIHEEMYSHITLVLVPRY